MLVTGIFKYNDKTISYTYNDAGIRTSKTIDGVTVAVASGGALALALIGSLKIATISATIGAASRSVTNGVPTILKGGTINDVGKSMVKGAIDGATDGFMWGVNRSRKHASS